MHPVSCVGLFILCLLCCTVVSGSRDGRSDDPEALAVTVARQSQLIDQMQAKLTSLETDIASCKGRIAQQEKEVGFTVRLSNTKPVVLHDILVLDVVDYSVGGGYDTLTGVFTAPLSGLYQFTFKITHTPPGRIHAGVYKNGKEIAEAEANGDSMDRSSATAAVHLSHGDRVWVEMADGNAASLESGWRTTFTGVLIRADRPAGV